MAQPSAGRTHSNVKGAPDYDHATYWDIKFATGQDVGEWLNSGDAVLEAVLAGLEDRYGGSGMEIAPRALHLGPGISKLGTKLQEAFTSRGWLSNGIVNVDFSAEAVRLGQEAEKDQHPSRAMQWIRTDLRSWTDVASLTPLAPFDVILDKSTSDAIATAEPQVFMPSPDPVLCPAVREIVEQNGETELSPVEVLALHLVPLTRAGATWAVLSYSMSRFDNIRYIGRYWEVASRTPLKAPTGGISSSAHTPEVFHWLYVLRRI
ncbi:uncharacterized protein ACHE_70914A [Aspergillus chevalieri]|uniref:Uncharacterized protein n=1 Tax=Aspergillus chevalieri TaxID=182096 RepID=A0A7R7VWK5_ASPCH|nr:uncharacterized protein ACHE_70914A [Aspergillus chevalieri]BCR92071.1 hypothetical protein ACHE_70914A [Aspergillus chevalieri]